MDLTFLKAGRMNPPSPPSQLLKWEALQGRIWDFPLGGVATTLLGCWGRRHPTQVLLAKCMQKTKELGGVEVP